MLLILAVFALHGAWPVPDVNEAHYLGKAKSYWDASWCPTDFFYHSADAHLIFYWTFGWLTRFLPLPMVAWCGRWLTWSLLAWTFRRLSVALIPRRWFAPLAATLFVFLNESLHMAGEWFDGGVEAKGFAYIFVFVALEALVRRRWNAVWLWLGVASALHVVIGGWSVIAAGVAWLASPGDRPKLTAMLPALAGGLVLSLAGILPAVLLSRGIDAATAAEASRIYVFERLPHHLNMDKVKDGYVTRHVMLGCLWLVLCSTAPVTPGRRLHLFVAGTVLLSAIGYLLVIYARYEPVAASAWLRFYWFRMTDVFIPLGVTIAALAHIEWMRVTRPRLSRVWLAAALALAAIDIGSQALLLAAQTSPRTDKNVVYGDWRAMCDWVAENTPPDATFLTPRLGATFKWHTGRSEVVTWKDIPQDSAGIVEWWRRMKEIWDRPDPTPLIPWHESLAELGWDRLQQLGREYHADYAVVTFIEGEPRLPVKPLYENKNYAVYRLNDPEQHP